MEWIGTDDRNILEQSKGYVMSTPIEILILYKKETGTCPFGEVEIEFEVWRSKGQWVLNISDAEKFDLSGRMGLIQFNKPDEDYIEWLEQKLLTFIKNTK